MPVIVPRAWEAGLRRPLKASTPPLVVPNQRVGTAPLYQWPMDDPAGALGPQAPTETRSGSSGHQMLIGTGAIITSPSNVGGNFGNWMTAATPDTATNGVVFPVNGGLLDGTRFKNALTLDFWLGADFAGPTAQAELILDDNVATQHLNIVFGGGLGGFFSVNLLTTGGVISGFAPIPASFALATPEEFRIVVENGGVGAAPTVTVFPHLGIPFTFSGVAGETVPLFTNPFLKFTFQVQGDVGVSASAGFDNPALFSGAFKNFAIATNQNQWPGINA